MSLSVRPLEIVQALEPRTKIYNKRSYAILRGGTQSSWRPVSSTSYSNSSISFTCPPPNPNIIVDRKIMANFQIKITLNGDAGVGNLLYKTLVSAPRAHPLAYIVNTLAVTINNTQVSTNLNDIVDPLFHYWDPVKKREIDNSLSPSMLDQFQNYSDITTGSRDPLNVYASSISGADTSRGSFPFTVLTNTQTQATILLDVTDYLYLSPFLSDQQDGAGFINVQNMDFVFTLGDLSRAWSCKDVSLSNITSVTGEIANLTVNGARPPRLLFNYITPDPLMQIPRSVVYPYFEVQRYPTAIGSLASNASTDVTSANIQLHSIPNKMYVFARRRNMDRSAFTSDVFAGLNNISVNWNNKSGLLSSATPQDLYHLSQVNGLQNSWTQWSKYVGACLCIQFGRDIALEPNECAGMLGTYQLQINANITNLNQSNAVNFDFYVVTVSEGSFTIEDNRAIANIGVVSQSDVLNSVNAPMIDYNDAVMMRGGSFWDNVKGFFGDVGRGIKKAYDTVAPVVEKVLPYAMQAKKLLGYGAMSGGRMRKAKKSKKATKKRKGTKKGRGLSGGVVYGGELIDRDQMSHGMDDSD